MASYSMSAIKNQLQLTKQTIKNFKDGVEADDLTRYSNVDNRLRGLEKSLEKASNVLISLENRNIQHFPDFDELMITVNDAIGAIKGKKALETTGSLAAALAALSEFQASLNDIERLAPSDDEKRKVEKVDTDTDVRE